MHQYTDNPDNFPGQVTIVDDSDAPNASNFNTPAENLGDRTAWLMKRLRTPNFFPGYALTISGAGPDSFQASCWDPVSLRWIVGLLPTSATPQWMTGRGDPQTWIGLFSSALSGITGGTWLSLVRGIEPSVSSKYVYGAWNTGTTYKLVRGDTVGGSWALAVMPSAATDLTDMRLASRSGVVVAALGSSSAAHSQVYYSTDSGTTWSAQSSTLSITAAIPNWLLRTTAAGGVMAVPGIAGPPAYLTSTDGVTWVAQTGLAGLVGATEVPSALAWGVDDKFQSCWVLATWDGTSARVYRSYDGATWTAVATVPSGVKVSQLVFVTDPMVLLGRVDPPALGVRYARVIYSVDGGVTWRQTSTEVLVGSAASLAAGPNQALVVGGNAYVTVGVALGDPGGIGPA